MKIHCGWCGNTHATAAKARKCALKYEEIKATIDDEFRMLQIRAERDWHMRRGMVKITKGAML